jgi:acyl-CoA synthetase (AMP-forming)/AMP-acid ligase II
MSKDEEGYCYLAGRSMDMIKSGGINVYPAEVERVLASHPGIKEAAVIGRPDRDWGERVIACVVTDGACTESEILEFRRSRLAGLRAPDATRLRG